MKWQPMPAVARLPSGTRVEVLCGQPEQKYGMRAKLVLVLASDFSLDSRNARRASIRSLVWNFRAHVGAPVVELLLELVLDDRALFLDHQDFLEPLGELARAFALERPDHADLVHADADVGRHLLVDTEVVERLAHVEIGLAGGDDAEARIGAVDDHAVELVGAGEGQRCIELVLLVAVFLVEEIVGPAVVQAALGHFEIVRQVERHAVRIDRDRARAFHRLGDGLEADPAARIARHGPAQEAEIEHVLHPGRVEHRHHGGDEGVVALVRQGRGARRVVVAGQRQHAAVLAGADDVGVLEDVAAAVDARPLAVPHAEHAVVFGAREQVDLLGAPDRGRRHVLVQPGLELDVVVLEHPLRPPEVEVERAQGRAAIAGDITRRVEAGGEVALALHDGQADQRLHPGQKDPSLPGGVFVVERDSGERHEVSPKCRCCLMR
jgi:hypothetical protein